MIASGSKYLLITGIPHKGFTCNKCGESCGKTTKAVRNHYQRVHSCAVTISSKSHALDLRQQTPSRPASSSSLTELLTEDIDMEDDDTPTSVHLPSPNPQSDDDAPSSVHLPSQAVPLFDAGVRGDSPDPQSDDDHDNDDEWDVESVVSDASTEVLLEEDEDDIVPRSFNPSTSADPSLHNDRLELDEQSPEDFPESEEGPPPPPAGVYRSDSESPRSFHLR